MRCSCTIGGSNLRRLKRLTGAVLSYRHLFHAGNHGDVLKHLVLIRVIEHMKRKATPFVFIDTHAGAGRYDLHAEWARKTREHETGIGRLWDADDLPPLLENYVAQVRNLNQAGDLRYYPGSAWIAQQLLRSGDRLRLFELQADESGELERLAGGDRRVRVSRSDGYAALRALLPVPQRRALVLMDPSYEQRHDYQAVVAALREGLARCAGCTYLVWYPVVAGKGNDLRTMLERIRSLAPDKSLRIELCVNRDSVAGMSTSGIMAINPPWTLAADLAPVLEYLARRLAGPGGGHFLLDPDPGR